MAFGITGIPSQWLAGFSDGVGSSSAEGVRSMGFESELSAYALGFFLLAVWRFGKMEI
jgi:hypothetical protein